MKKTIIGVVVSNKMTKSAVVKVDHYWKHPLYRKAIKRSKKYLVHDEIGVKEEDKVKIMETRPVSKRKRWRIVEVIK